MAEPLSPDGGEALRVWLRSLTSIAPTVGTRVGLTLTGTAPAIRYAQIGPGANLSGGAAAYAYQIEVWGPGGNVADDGTTDTVARRIVSETPGFVGIIGSATVNGASARMPYRADDPETARPRSIVEVTFVIAP